MDLDTNISRSIVDSGSKSWSGTIVLRGTFMYTYYSHIIELKSSKNA